MKTKLTLIIAAIALAACGKPQIKLTFEGMESDNIVVVTTAIKDIPKIEDLLAQVDLVHHRFLRYACGFPFPTGAF